VDRAIEVTDLVKRYRRVEAVRGVTLEVRAGETVGYVGPNGAGKTTTIRCMLGLLRASSGSIRILGREVPGQLSWVLERVGHIPGEFGLWPQLTGRQCLDYLGRLQHRPAGRRSELCERFELPGADLDRHVHFYSRGMRQKIAIVQAFQHNPELVIMDEPTEGLDPVMKDRFLALLADHRAAGGSALMSSHILSEVEQAADRVAVLRAGRVIKEVAARDLTGDRVRHCTLTLANPAEAAAVVELPGAVELARDGDTLRFDHRGDMAPLLRALAGLTVVEFLSEPGNLLEAFFKVSDQDRR
jgi:ABC-2 type transport system ATP-binding protein